MSVGFTVGFVGAPVTNWLYTFEHSLIVPMHEKSDVCDMSIVPMFVHLSPPLQSIKHGPVPQVNDRKLQTPHPALLQLMVQFSAQFIVIE